MCRPKTEGGQRCHAHAAADLSRAATSLGIAPFDLPRASASSEDIDRYRQALIETATTARGAANLWQAVGTYPDGHLSRRELERVFSKAVKLRQSREDAYAQWKAAQGDDASAGRDMLDPEQWAVTGGPRCGRCGQYTSQATTHQCPTRLTMLPTVAPSRYACIADGGPEAIASLPLEDGMPAMSVEDARIIAADLAGDDLDIDPDLEDALVEYAHTTGVDDLEVDEQCPPDASRRLGERLAEELDSQLMEAAQAGAYLDARRFETAQGAFKAGAVTEIADRIHRLDPAISPDRATGIANTALRTWALNYSHDAVTGTDLDDYQRAAEQLAAGENPLQGNPLDSPGYDAGIAVIAQYQYTQEWLARNNITHLEVYRGVSFYDGDSRPEFHQIATTRTPGREGSYYEWVPDWVPAEQLEDDEPATIPFPPGKAMSSWSDRSEVAGMFAESSFRPCGYLLTTTVPAERILSTPRTGSGCYIEREAVILDGPGQCRIQQAP